MSLRTKVHILFWLIIVGGLVSLFLATSVDDRFGVIALMLPFAWFGYSSIFLRCQGCGEHMGKRKTKFLGVEFTYWGGWTVPKSCSRCGRKF